VEKRTGATVADFEAWCELVSSVDIPAPKGSKG